MAREKESHPVFAALLAAPVELKQRKGKRSWRAQNNTPSAIPEFAGFRLGALLAADFSGLPESCEVCSNSTANIPLVI